MTSASQIFFHLRREADGAIFGFLPPEGLTVPIFSSMALAVRALETVAARGHAVGPIAPMQLEPFSSACRGAGAKFIQLDPGDTSLLQGPARHLIV